MANRILETHDGQEKIGAVDGSNRVYRGTGGLWGYSNLGSAVVRLPGTATQFTIRTFHSDSAGQPPKCDTTPAINLPGIFTLMGSAVGESILCPSVLRPGGNVPENILNTVWTAIQPFDPRTAAFLEMRDTSAPYNVIFNSLVWRGVCGLQPPP